jgi:hypothetical protein
VELARISEPFGSLKATTLTLFPLELFLADAKRELLAGGGAKILNYFHLAYLYGRLFFAKPATDYC